MRPCCCKWNVTQKHRDYFKVLSNYAKLYIKIINLWLYIQQQKIKIYIYIYMYIIIFLNGGPNNWWVVSYRNNFPPSVLYISDTSRQTCIKDDAIGKPSWPYWKFDNPVCLLIRPFCLGTKVAGLTRLDCIYITFTVYKIT